MDEFKIDSSMVGSEKSFLKNYNNIYISDEQIEILKKYDIDINKYASVKELIYDIEDFLNNSYEVPEDLEWVSESLAEYNYYNNINR